MSALDSWKARNIFEMELPSGVKVKGRYIDMETTIGAGSFDFSVLQNLENAVKAEAQGEETPDSEAVAEGIRYKRYVVCASVLEVDGEKTTVTEEDYGYIPEADRTAIFTEAVRAGEAPLEAAG